jgi:Holliday junction DNA helicase RuvB
MAHVIANEMNTGLKVTSGTAIERAGDLASLLTNLQKDDILFIDEIHRLPKSVYEVLYGAMEDFVLDIIVGKGTTANTLRIDLPQFTIIGATTRTGVLPTPLRDRFGIIHRLEFYNLDEIKKVLNRTAMILNVKLSEEASFELSKRARLTPRIANRLLRRIRDYAEIKSSKIIEKNIVDEALEYLQIDSEGLDPLDRELLSIIHNQYKGGPVGVETLSAMLAEDKTTIEDYYEPYLMQIGFLERTPRGRKTTIKASAHLKKLGYNKI